MLRLTSFSMTPEAEILPGSLPPWPGSITITVELVFLPVFLARAQTPLPRKKDRINRAKIRQYLFFLKIYIFFFIMNTYKKPDAQRRHRVCLYII